MRGAVQAGAVLLLLVGAEPARARAPADAEFLPLQVGSRWSYVSSEGHESEEIVTGAVEVKEAGGRLLGTAAEIRTSEAGEIYYLRTANGVARFYESPSPIYDKERVTWMLRFPLQLGAHWESWTPAGKVEFRVTDRRSMTAPDGSLTDGVRVDFVSLPEPIFAGHIWYARGLGAVEVVEGDYSRKLLGFRQGEGVEIPVADRVEGLEPPDLAAAWRLGRKGWFALALVVAAALGVAILPRLERPSRKRPWEEPAPPPVLVEEEGSLPVQAARLESSIAAHPSYADLHCKLGQVYLAMERVDDSIAQFQTALERNPHYVQAGLGLTRAFSKAARWGEAIGTIRPLSERHPTYADVQNLLGETLAGSGDFAGATAAFRAALEINPKFAAARDNLDRCTTAAAGAAGQPPAGVENGQGKEVPGKGDG